MKAPDPGGRGQAGPGGPPDLTPSRPPVGNEPMVLLRPGPPVLARHRPVQIRNNPYPPAGIIRFSVANVVE